MDEETRRKIGETVKEILQNADMEEMTEFKVRFAASKRLGIDLFGPEQKVFVRGVVEDFLLSGDDGVAVSDHPEKAKETVQETDFMDGYQFICKLSNKRNVMLNEFRGRTYLQIRDYYPKDGKQIPSTTGIALTIDQWSAIKQSFPAVEEAIKRMQSNLRSEGGGEENGDMTNSAEVTKNRDVPNSAEPTKNRDMSNSAEATKNGSVSNSVEATKNRDTSNSAEATKNGSVSSSAEAAKNRDTSNSADAAKNGSVSNSAQATKNRGVSNSVEAVTHEFVPIETTRFDGKNYHSWAAKMGFFLQQLNIAYLLTEPPRSAPSTVGNKERLKAKATDQKWLSDDHLCRHCILNTLSDPLYNQFSKKTYSARELWEELRLVYLYEEHGTKRSLVRKYLEFQILDGKRVYEQVQELNNLADAIVATGTLIDENFHVSAILSKLPASWKDASNKLMREEHLPFWMLMECLRNEQDSRNGDEHGESSKSPGFKSAGPGSRPGDSRKLGLPLRRQEPETNRKFLLCSNCGKRGHVASVCRHR